MLRITAFLAVIIPIFVSAQTYQISGRVSGSDGVVLPGAVVMVHENLITVETGKNGDFLIPGLKPGKYHLHIRYIGYESAEKDVTIGSTHVVLDVEMSVAELEIKEYVVEESLLKAREGESSLKIIVAGKEFLRRNPGFSLSNQLESLPGIHSLNTGTGIAKPVIRGFSFQRVVADKGIKQEGQQWGSDHGLEIDQFDVDRLEIIKGPSSLIFGSDAIGGVINIRLPEYPAKNSLQVNTASTYRSANDLWAMSGQIKANISDLLLSFRYSHQDYADYRVPADSFTYNSYKLPLHNQKLKNTAGREQNFSASIGLSRNWGYSILSVSRFSQRAGFFSGAHGIPQSYQLGLDGDSRNIDIPYQFVEHYKVISNTNLQIRKGWLEIDLGYQRNFRQEFSVAENHGNDYVFDTTNIEHQLALITVSGNLRYHFGKEKSGKWILGGSGQYQENQFAGFEFLLPNYRGWGAGTYLYFARKLSLRWHLNAGIRGDINRLDVQAYSRPVHNSNGDIYAYQWKNGNINRLYGNLSGGIGFSLRANERNTLKWNLASSFRVPSVAELASNGVHHGTFRHEMGDSSLQQERGFQFDFSLEHKRKKWMLDFTPFFYYFNNFISLNPTGEFSPLPEAGQLYQYGQADAIHTGAELHTDIHFTKRLHLGCYVDYVFGFNLESGYPLPLIPPGTGRLELEYEFALRSRVIKKPFLKFVARGAAPQLLTARNERKTDGYIVLALSGGIQLEYKKFKLDLICELQNLTNQSYMVHINRYRLLNLPEPGRNLAVSLYMSFDQFFQKNSRKDPGNGIIKTPKSK